MAWPLTGCRQDDALDAYLKLGVLTQLSWSQVQELQSKSTGEPVEVVRLTIKPNERCDPSASDPIIQVLRERGP